MFDISGKFATLMKIMSVLGMIVKMKMMMKKSLTDLMLWVWMTGMHLHQVEIV